MRQEEEEEKPIPLFLTAGEETGDREGGQAISQAQVSIPHPRFQSGGDVFDRLRKTPCPGICEDHLTHSLLRRGVACGHITGRAASHGDLCGS